MSGAKYIYQSKSNRNKLPRICIISIFLIISSILSSGQAIAGSGSSDSVMRDMYTFIPEGSTLHRFKTNGYTLTESKYYLIDGQFGFYGDRFFADSSYFTDSNAVIIDTDNNVPVELLGNVFNFNDIVGTFTNSTTVRFEGFTTDGSNSTILLILTFNEDLVYLNGTITPPSPGGYFFELNAVAKRKYGGGIGTFQYPYLISTAEHMNTIGTKPGDWSSHFKLTQNISLSVYKNSFNIIGYYKSDIDNKSFAGSFNGDNKTISGFTYVKPAMDRIGIFGYLNKDTAEIKDLGIIDPNISSQGGKYIGALVGHLVDGNITNCYVSGGQVSGSDMVGGLIGWNNTKFDITELEDELCEAGKVTRCTCDSNVTGISKVGGLIGLNDGIVIDCNSVVFADVNGISETGSLIGKNNGMVIDCNLVSDANIVGVDKIGGLVGLNTSLIIDCTASGEPNVIGTKEVGGLVGLNKGFIVDCNTTGTPKVTGQTKIGGLTGINDGIVSNCNALVDLNVSGKTEIGGFAGYNIGFIEDCNSLAIVSGENQIGGMIGYNVSVIRNCYAVSTVTGDKRIGALVGKNSGHISECSVEGNAIGLENVAGIAGTNDGGYIKGCASMCDVEGSLLIAAIAGTNSGSIINCFSNGDISGGFYVSGGAGKNYFQIVNCVSEANVEVQYGYAGGLAGSNESNGWIENSYATGNISGRINVGGLLGYNDGVVLKCYSKGLVTDNYANDQISVGFGGLIGAGTEEACAILSVWDIQTSNQAISAGGKGKTTDEMKNKTTFTDWAKTTPDDTGDEVIYWTINQQGGKDYPRLSWENIPGDVIQPVFITDILAGSGTENNPFLVDSADKLNSIGLFPHEWDKHYKLSNNINLSSYAGTKYNLIGYYRIPFAGTFDGNNRVISNFTFDSAQQSYVGIFGCIGSYLANVKNVGMTNVTINAKDNIGSLAGYLKEGKIQNCYSENVNITGREAVAGLVGYNLETISSSYSTGDVTGMINVGGLVGNNYEGTINECNANSIVSGDSAVGGLVGNSSGSIKASTSTCNLTANTLVGGIVGYNTGTVENTNSSGYVSGNENVGGLIGSNKGKLTNCYSNAGIYGDFNVGGLIGYNKDAEIINCNAIGNVYGRLSTGGLIGHSSGLSSIANCYANNSVTGYESIGGLIGKNEGSISKSFSRGIVSGTMEIGGLVGWNLELASITDSYSRDSVLASQWAGGLVGINNGSITKCYSSGNVAGTKMTVGGLVAINYGTSSGSFWDTDTSGQTESATGTGKTTENMQKKTTYTSAGWDFNNTWTISENQDYPKLNWEGN